MVRDHSILASEMNVSRRAFIQAGAALTAAQTALPQSTGEAFTAGQVIARIKANIGIPWRAQTVDNIIVGTPETRVKGIATTRMSTLDVVQRAAAALRNMVITHEPTFFSHQDKIDGIAQDETYLFKLD